MSSDDLICSRMKYSRRGQQLDAMLISNYLSGIVYFPTRNHNQSRSAIGNIFIGVSKFEN
jgi:hypothetical protein